MYVIKSKTAVKPVKKQKVEKMEKPDLEPPMSFATLLRLGNDDYFNQKEDQDDFNKLIF